MTRHAFLGSGQYSAKWLGEYDTQWDDFRRSIVATIEMNMFGFSLVNNIQYLLTQINRKISKYLQKKVLLESKVLILTFQEGVIFKKTINERFQ